MLNKLSRQHLKEMAYDLLPELKYVFLTLSGNGILFKKVGGIESAPLTTLCNIIATRLSKRMREQGSYEPVYDPLVLRIAVHRKPSDKIEDLWKLYWAFKFPFKLEEVVTLSLHEKEVTFKDLVKAQPKALNSIHIEITHSA